jgi:hypothetical protein
VLGGQLREIGSLAKLLDVESFFGSRDELNTKNH